MSLFRQFLRLGMVGGGTDSLIGVAHRRGAALGGGMDLVSGALSSTPERSIASGETVGLEPDRNYESWEQMLEGELSLPEEHRVDLISVVTPNDLHFPVAHAFAERGFNVVVDKPMVLNSEEAERLVNVVRQAGVVFCVSYQYTGYPMVKQARHLVRSGELGEIRKVIVEYSQGWLAERVEASGSKQASWRTDPEKSGPSGTMGDIGTHAENLASMVTGLEPEEICADLSTFVPGRLLDDDAAVLIRYANGARGVLMASQVATGEDNSFGLKVYGSRGGLEWSQDTPNELYYRRPGALDRVYGREDVDLCEEARAACLLSPDHPEASFEAFANLYSGVANGIHARLAGESPDTGTFPTVHDGARGIRFIESTVESARSEQKWTEVSR